MVFGAFSTSTMVAYSIIALTLWVAAVNSALLTSRPGPGCSTSSDCSKGLCCRGNDGRLKDPNTWDWGPWGMDSLTKGGAKTGTCQQPKGQEHEVCSKGCECDEGLACYRPMTGACCPPSTCRTIEYVKKQQEFWRNCSRNPKCHFPA